MQIKVIAIGKLKESYWRDAAAEYIKRLGRFARLNVVELAESRLPDKASARDEERVKSAEGEAILSKITAGEYVIVLAPRGRATSSEGFAEMIAKRATYGDSRICFIIGGSLGLSEEVYTRSDQTLRFGEMTFPHQMFRVMLLEQLYRAFKINNNESYHK